MTVAFRPLAQGDDRLMAGMDALTTCNPADRSDLVSSFRRLSGRESMGVVERAAAASRPWASRSSLERGDILREAAGLMSSAAPEIVDAIVRETGKVLGEATGEVAQAVKVLNHYAGLSSLPLGEVLPSRSAETMIWTSRVPLGVVAAITPWNFPLAIPCWKVVPALLAGNTVVLKPSQIAPTAAWYLVDCLVRAGVPRDALGLVIADNRDAAAAIIDNPMVRAVSFTGSNGVGRMIASRVAVHGGKVQLEMGGNNPAIVLDDADVDSAAAMVVDASMAFAGQKCTATSRVIATPGVFQELSEALATRVASLRVGDPRSSNVDVGPVINDEAAQEIRQTVDSALRAGASLLAHAAPGAGQSLNEGSFAMPSLLTDVPHGHRLAEGELFGPVLSLMRADTLFDAIELANAVPFGLSASVMTSDVSATLNAVRDLDAGVIKINGSSTGIEPQVPFGGLKDSSAGPRELGTAALQFFTQTKSVYLSAAVPTRTY